MNGEQLRILKSELLRGDTHQLEQFFFDYKQDCLNVLRSKNLCSILDFEDIFSDSLIILHNNLLSNKIESLTSVKNYLIGTCINLAKKKIQLEIRTQKKIEDIRLLFYAQGDYRVDEEDLNEERMVIVQKARSQLTEKCQTIITAFYIYKLSMKEIAEELNLSSSDVAKTLKSRCFKQLLKLVKNLRTTES